MTLETLLQQINLAEQLTFSDFGVSTGVLTQSRDGVSDPHWVVTHGRKHEVKAKLGLFQSQKPLYHHARGP